MKELDRQEDIKIHVGITINKDTKKCADNLVVNWPTLDINLFNPETNVGYLNGLFLAYEGLLKVGRLSDWTIFCNTDIEIPNNELLKVFLSKKYDEEIYCIAPSVYEKNRQVYENPQYKSRYSLNSLDRRIFIFNKPKLAEIYIFLSKAKATLIRKNKKEPSCFVYSAHGSFFFLKSDFLNEIDRHYMSLMYSEEAFIAEEIRLLSKKIYYDNQLEVIHNESQNTGKLGVEKKSRYIAESLNEIRNKYFISGENKK